jgi:hypothetical protein
VIYQIEESEKAQIFQIQLYSLSIDLAVILLYFLGIKKVIWPFEKNIKLYLNTVKIKQYLSTVLVIKKGEEKTKTELAIPRLDLNAKENFISKRKKAMGLYLDMEKEKENCGDVSGVEEKENEKTSNGAVKEVNEDGFLICCILCNSKRINCIARSCGHCFACRDCLSQILIHNKLCIICRNKITKLSPVFF